MRNLMRGCVAVFVLLALAACQPAEQESTGEMEAGAMPEAGTAEYKMANPMSAAFEDITAAATLMDWPQTEGGELTVLREGTNGWTCLPDFPDTPADDPVCGDEMTMAFLQAWMTRTEPDLAEPGIGYMLQGGASASATDPFATEPPPGEDWIEDPPHIMLFPTKGMDLSGYPTEPGSGGPWVMFVGTPYAHVMIPVE